MKVYELTYVTFGYGEGICLVAANNHEEALEVANRGCYKFEEPQECHILTADCEEPRVLIEMVYQE